MSSLKQRTKNKSILLVPSRQGWFEDMLYVDGRRYKYVIVWDQSLGFLNSCMITAIRKWSKPKHA